MDVETDIYLCIPLQSVVAETVATVWWHWLLAKLFAGVGVGMLQVGSHHIFLCLLQPNHRYSLLFQSISQKYPLLKFEVH